MYSIALDYWYNKAKEDLQQDKTPPTSQDYKNQLQQMLSVTSQAVDDLYDFLKNE